MPTTPSLISRNLFSRRPSQWFCSSSPLPSYPTLPAVTLAMTSTHSSLVSISHVPTLQFASGSMAPLHRSSFFSPPLHSYPNPAPRQIPLEPSADQNSHVHDRDNHVSTAGDPVYTIHTYCLKEYAYVFINSHADSPQDIPVIYRGEETTGTVQLPQRCLQEVQSIIVVVRRLIVGMTMIELYI